MSISSLGNAPTSSFESQPPRVSKPPSISIYDLDDDSLLHIFGLSRRCIIDVEASRNTRWVWERKCWWYKFVQVCRRWRLLIFGSASHLDLSLVCAPGIPVADMLAHSPPLPLIIGYDNLSHELTAKDEEGMMLALGHRDRVKCIYLRLPVSNLQKIMVAIDDAFPTLEYLHIGPPTRHNTRLTLPLTFEAPHLRYLELTHFASAMDCSLLSTAIGLVMLSLDWIHPSTYPHPDKFLRSFSLLPQLETLNIRFRSPVPNRGIERQLFHTPVITHVTHPNLRVFEIMGVSAFSDSLLSHMTMPLLASFRVEFFNQLHFSVPHLPSFIMTAEKLRFNRVEFIFHQEAAVLLAYTDVGSRSSSFDVSVSCQHLDWQVHSMAQISTVLRPLFSLVADLTLGHQKHALSSEWHNQGDRTWWRELLGSFRNAKTLRVHNDLVGAVSHALRSDREPVLEVLPELKELVCPVGNVDDQTFAPFIREREGAGQSVNIVGVANPADLPFYHYRSSAGLIAISPDPSPHK